MKLQKHDIDTIVDYLENFIENIVHNQNNPSEGAYSLVVARRDTLRGYLMDMFGEKEPEELKPDVYEGVKCPECDGEMISRKGKYGTFWGCKKYPKCNGTRDSEGKSREDREREKQSKQEAEPLDERFKFTRG